jgi:hypothetical protein
MKNEADKIVLTQNEWENIPLNKIAVAEIIGVYTDEGQNYVKVVKHIEGQAGCIVTKEEFDKNEEFVV